MVGNMGLGSDGNGVDHQAVDYLIEISLFAAPDFSTSVSRPIRLGSPFSG
jgi:hypothetical protein